jgi:hypothetical protein
MSEDDESIESRLRALHPRAVSPDLWDRVRDGLAADELRAPLPTRRGGWRWLLPLAAAAAVAIAAALWPRSGPEPPGNPPTVEKRATWPSIEGGRRMDPAPAMVGTYSLALTRSPEALSRLLDRDAAALSPPACSPASARSSGTDANANGGPS